MRAGCRVHYTSGHYQALLFQRSTDEMTVLRDDFRKKDYTIVSEKLRKRINVQIRVVTKLHKKKKWLCIAGIAQSN